jgi:KDO2-lipid IV(A) lauroyltransferase
MRAALSICLLRILARLPLAWLHALGSLLGRALHRLPCRERRNARKNLALCFPDLTAEQHAVLHRRTLQEFGKTITELAALWCWDVERVLSLVRQVSGASLLREAIAGRQGVIVLVPHLGAWELAGLYLSRLGDATHLYRPPSESGLEAFMCRARERGGARLMAATTPQGLRAVFRALNRGEMVGMLPDQVARSRASAIAPFFGVPARTMLLVSRLAKRTGATVVFAFAERLPRHRGYHMRFLAAPEKMADTDPKTAASALNRGVEQCVRICPEQYQWTYRRFARNSARGGWDRGADRNNYGSLRGTDARASRKPV